MTNGAGAGSGPPASYASGPSAGSVPRRMSYASVASGVAQQAYSNPSRSGAFSHLANTTPSSSYPPQYLSEPRRPRTYSGQEAEMNTNGSVPFGSAWRKSAPLPAYSRQYANVPGYGYSGSMPPNAFFVPSYLRHSRYVASLEAAHKAKAQAQRESTTQFSRDPSMVDPMSNPPSLSTSASNANVHRMAPSHRGMTYDIIESNPPKDEDQLMPLPSKLSEMDKYPGLDLLADGFEVRYNGVTSKVEMEAAMVRADFPMPPQCGIYYFEVEIKSKTKEGMIAVGFSTQKASLERLPGWESESWAYHGDDGKTFCGETQPKIYAAPFGTGDIIGCGINFHTGQAFFTKNGVSLGVAFRDLKNIRPFPSIGMKKHSGAMAYVNLGQKPFVYDIDDMMAKQQRSIQMEISRTKVSTLQPPLDESTLLQELVANYLTHDGYVETAKAFAQEVKTEKRALHLTQDTNMEDVDVDEDLEAVNRQKIRAAILEGDIEAAISYTNDYFPQAFYSNSDIDILFRLKCRRWIELILRSNELSHPTNRKTSRAYSTTSNGHTYNFRRTKGAVDDVFDQDMELDDDDDEGAHSANGQFKNENDLDLNGENTQADRDESAQLLKDAMEYGTTLMREYGHGYGREVGSREALYLNEIFSLIAYPDAKTSVHGHLLDPAGRVNVAEELNSAILVSLGRSSSAALERLYKQTEALIAELSLEGGPAAFVNLQELKPF